VRWTGNRWNTHQTTPCVFKRRHRGKHPPVPFENPNRYGTGLWISRLPVHNLFGIEYAVACECRDGILWDNNLGINYRARRRRLKVLTLNLHCYQEDRQDEKFSLIAEAVADMDIDIVCLQEVGEPVAGNGRSCSRLNAARVINERLKRPYHMFADWSHIGFDSYREGVAILSRYPFMERDSGFVSPDTDPHTIHSRKVCLVRVDVPYMGPVDIFCVHLSWWENGFSQQFENLRAWASSRQQDRAAATLLCGDFNAAAGSCGYRLVTRDFVDQFRTAVLQEWCGGDHRCFERRFGEDGRIDHIFMNKSGQLKPAAARVLFTDNDYGRVSDHFGYYLEFEPAYC
jgi:maltose 6'-phosphate phosphatase